VTATPRYPIEAIRQAKQGRVVTCFLVDAAGSILEPEVIELSDDVFREPTLTALRRSRYEAREADSALRPSCRSYTFTLGKHSFAGILRDAKTPMIIVGPAAAARTDGAAILAMAAKVALLAADGKDAGWNAFNVLHTAASRVAGLDLGFASEKASLDLAALDVVYLLGADEIDMGRLGKAFVIYQGSHGDAGAERADIVLPGATYTEKSATYVNIEGRAQMTARAAFAPGDAKEDWSIIRALSGHVGKTLPYDNLQALRAAMFKVAPALARLDSVEPADAKGVEAMAGAAGALGAEPFGASVLDFYLTNPVARASAVMAELSALKKNMSRGTTGTHG
jgi:NADH-quinone oxidoreductase subunit G